MITETANFGSSPSRLDSNSLQSWTEMQRIQLLADEMGCDFARAFSEYQHRLAVGLPVPVAPSATFAESRQPTATVSFGEFGQVNTADLAQDQLNSIAEINGIVRNENVSFEEAAKRYVDRHPEKY